jgi:hypothetical protein
MIKKKISLEYTSHPASSSSDLYLNSMVHLFWFICISHHSWGHFSLIVHWPLKQKSHSNVLLHLLILSLPITDNAPFDVLIDWLIGAISAICSALWCIFTDLIIIIWHCQTCSTRKQNLCPLMRQNMLWKLHYKNNYR